MPISSLQNERIKQAVKLRDRKGRVEQRRIVIDGMREIGRALGAGVQIELLFVCDELHDDASRQLTVTAQRSAAETVEVTRPVMEKLAFGDRVQAVLAVAHPPQNTLESLAVRLNLKSAPLSKERRGEPSIELATAPLVAVLEGVEKPGNLGAMLRTADAAGVSAVIVADGGTDLYNPNAIRASLGAIFTLPICAADASSVLAWLRKHTFSIWAARVDAAVNYAEAKLTGRCSLILGSEAHGLTPVWQGADVKAIALPMLGKVDSLNVSATAAVLFYESLRQRTGVNKSIV